jgi:hypothetical protein
VELGGLRTRECGISGVEGRTGWSISNSYGASIIGRRSRSVSSRAVRANTVIPWPVLCTFGRWTRKLQSPVLCISQGSKVAYFSIERGFWGNLAVSLFSFRLYFNNIVWYKAPFAAVACLDLDKKGTESYRIKCLNGTCRHSCHCTWAHFCMFISTFLCFEYQTSHHWTEWG